MSKITWKLRAGATWRQKLEQEHPSHGKIVPIPRHMQKTFGKGRMVIPKPLDVDALMRKATKGTLLTPSQIRQQLAVSAKVDAACPLTTGIFIRIAAEAAEEDARRGKKRITPYWRTIKDDGRLNDKFPGGAKNHARRLRAEGFILDAGRGASPPKVRDFEAHLVRL